MSTNKEIEFSLPLNPLPERLQSYRLSRKFTDLTLQVGEEQFPVHRVVIEDSSPVLKELLEELEGEQVCDLSDRPVCGDVFGDLLTFFYTARLLINESNARSLLVTAHDLQVTHLVAATERFLSDRVTPKNVLEQFLFSLRPHLGLLVLREHCITCLIDNIEAVLKGERILEYTLEEFQTLIQQINNRKEEPKLKEFLFECIMKWVENDSSSRSAHLPSLLRSLPLSGLSLTYLGKVVSTQNKIADSQLCSRVLNEAFSEAILNSKGQKSPSNTNQQLYCFGGYYGRQTIASSVSRMDPLNGFQWKSCSPMLTARADFAGAAIGPKVYLCGGVSADGKLSAVEVYDCESQTTERLPSMPHPRWATAAAAVGGGIYVAGGRDLSGRTLSTVIRYNTLGEQAVDQLDDAIGDQVVEQWTPVSSMHSARRDHQLVECRGKLYAICGGGGNSKVEVYEPETDRWSNVSGTKSAHCWYGATEHEGRVYVCSQYGFEVYSPASDHWEELTALNYCLGRCLVSMGGKLWAIGGGSVVETASIYCYEPRIGYWIRQPDMDIARMHHCSFVVES